MVKELSIESIKKDIIDKLMNNMDILKYLEAERRVAEGTRLEEFFNRFIYDHDTTCAGANYISVEVAEHDGSYTHEGMKFFDTESEAWDYINSNPKQYIKKDNELLEIKGIIYEAPLPILHRKVNSPDERVGFISCHEGKYALND